MIKEMQKDLKTMIRNAKVWKEDPCNSSCPFCGYEDCIPCYLLFPGWGDFYLDENSFKTYDQRTAKTDCPCNTLDKEFVSWRIQLFLKKGTI